MQAGEPAQIDVDLAKRAGSKSPSQPRGLIAVLAIPIIVTFGLALACAVTLFPGPACVSHDSSPPNIIGDHYDKIEYHVILPHNSSETRPYNRAQLIHRYSATSPPNPKFVVFERFRECGPDHDPSCVAGRAGDASACTWAWAGCQYTLYCAYGPDVAFRMLQPTRIVSNTVMEYEQTRVEIGPAHLVAGGLPNPRQGAQVSISTYERGAD